VLEPGIHHSLAQTKSLQVYCRLGFSCLALQTLIDGPWDSALRVQNDYGRVVESGKGAC
jgi:hypothetical protein